MAINFPTSLDSFTTTHIDTEAMANNHAQLHNDIAAAINALEAIIGAGAAGSFASIKAKLEKPDFVVWTKAGTLALGVGVLRVPLPFACTLVDVRAVVNTAPTGAAALVDVNKNGTTIFTTQANRPSIAIGANASGIKVPDVTAFASGDYLTVDIDQIGSTVAGSDLTVVVSYKRV